MNTLIFVLISIVLWKVLKNASKKVMQMNSTFKFIFIFFLLFVASEYFYLAKNHQFSFILINFVPEDVNNSFSRLFSFIFSIFMAFTCLPIKWNKK